VAETVQSAELSSLLSLAKLFFPSLEIDSRLLPHGGPRGLLAHVLKLLLRKTPLIQPLLSREALVKIVRSTVTPDKAYIVILEEPYELQVSTWVDLDRNFWILSPAILVIHPTALLQQHGYREEAAKLQQYYQYGGIVLQIYLDEQDKTDTPKEIERELAYMRLYLGEKNAHIVELLKKILERELERINKYYTLANILAQGEKVISTV